MKDLTPGFVCDLFVLRRKYDDEQHGITRITDDHDISEDEIRDFDELEGGRLDAEGDQDNTGRGRRSGI